MGESALCGLQENCGLAGWRYGDVDLRSGVPTFTCRKKLSKYRYERPEMTTVLAAKRESRRPLEAMGRDMQIVSIRG
jgi:hypothetical protein